MALKVTFSQTTKPLTIKSSAAATKLSTLADVDATGASAQGDGATLVYDAQTATYKSVQIFEETDDGLYKLDGGRF
jgi:hypothetical protein